MYKKVLKSFNNFEVCNFNRFVLGLKKMLVIKFYFNLDDFIKFILVVFK